MAIGAQKVLCTFLFLIAFNVLVILFHLIIKMIIIKKKLVESGHLKLFIGEMVRMFTNWSFNHEIKEEIQSYMDFDRVPSRYSHNIGSISLF